MHRGSIVVVTEAGLRSHCHLLSCTPPSNHGREPRPASSHGRQQSFCFLGGWLVMPQGTVARSHSWLLPVCVALAS